MKQKGFAPILILVLVVLVLVGYFGYKNFWPKLQSSVTPTPSASQAPTGNLANWKTYTSKEFGYSLKYPVGPEYIQETCNSDYGNTFMLDLEGDGCCTHPSKLCGPRDSYSSFELTPAKGRFAENEYPKSISGQEVTLEPITIDNVEGKKYTSIRTKDAPIPKKAYYVFVEHNGFKYRFIFIAFKHEYLFDQILSTFQFTGPSEASAKEDKFTCPANGWVDCMPVLDETKKQVCSPEAMAWYKANCPNFQGIAY